MQRLFRRKNQRPSGRGRQPIAWTAWEIALIVISLLLIVFPLYAEAYRWVNPSIVPAAQRETDTPVASPVPTLPTPPTDTPIPTSTPGGPTDTPRPTATAFTVTPGTVTTTPATDTPTLTPASATNTPIPTVASTPTPQPTFIGTPPLTLVKVASVASAGIGQQFSYSLSVFSNSATQRTIQVRDDVASQLDIVGTPSASNGSCSVSGKRVSCTVTAQTNRPATITITVRVRADATLGSRATNQAAASDDQSNTDLSDQVVVVINNQVIPPTDTPGPPPSATPSSATPSATSPVLPSATPTAGGPINTPVPGTPATAGPTDRPRTPAPDKTQPPGTKPTDLPRPPLPPTPRPGPPLPPTPRPGQPTPRPIGGTNATNTPVVSGPTATTTPAGTATLPPAVPGLFFRMASDWGSAFPGQEINYVIAASNTRTSGALRDVQITSNLPANLQILDAKADRGGDPLVTGNSVSLKLSVLNPGEGVEVAIKTRIKDSVAIGTQIVSQAELTFAGLALSAHSNIVTVLVVGVPPLQSTATLTPTSALATATPTTTPTTTPTATATVTSVPPTATGAPAIDAAAGGAAASGSAPLPNTSAGVPFLGILMLGMTLMFRTVRVHREQTRI